MEEFCNYIKIYFKINHKNIGVAYGICLTRWKVSSNYHFKYILNLLLMSDWDNMLISPPTYISLQSHNKLNIKSSTFLTFFCVCILCSFFSQAYITSKNKIKYNQNHNFKHGSTGMDAREVLTQTRLTLYKAG